MKLYWQGKFPNSSGNAGRLAEELYKAQTGLNLQNEENVGYYETYDELVGQPFALYTVHKDEADFVYLN